MAMKCHTLGISGFRMIRVSHRNIGFSNYQSFAASEFDTIATPDFRTFRTSHYCNIRLSHYRIFARAAMEQLDIGHRTLGNLWRETDNA